MTHGRTPATHFKLVLYAVLIPMETTLKALHTTVSFSQCFTISSLIKMITAPFTFLDLFIPSNVFGSSSITTHTATSYTSPLYNTLSTTFRILLCIDHHPFPCDPSTICTNTQNRKAA